VHGHIRDEINIDATDRAEKCFEGAMVLPACFRIFLWRTMAEPRSSDQREIDDSTSPK
jgi:hypothetical protein